MSKQTSSSNNSIPLERVYAHSSLYRKHRPEQWDEVSGQAHIVSVLEAESKKDQPSHAFLFAGSRGTGKTTMARIFAKQIGTAPEDIYEIDAASNTSVEDIRILNEAVYALPMNSRFKVYILDEVHMLSKSAFNAFLKTLEEPPKHVIFILATTELHKIPETIISRCQVFHLKKPGVEVLRDVIKEVAAKEGIIIDQEGLNMIAHFGNGSFRDTLSTLQTMIAAGGREGENQNKIPTKDIEEILGVPNHIQISEFIDAIIKNPNLEAAKKILHNVHTSDMDARLFTDLLISALRDELLNTGNGNAISAEQKEMIRMLELLLAAKGELGKTHINVLPLELALLKFFSVK